MEFADGKPRDAETVWPEPGPESASPERATGEGGGPADTAADLPAEKGAEVVDPKSATKQASGSRPFYFKRRRATTLLFIVFLITLVAAFFIYPRRAAVYRPQSFSVSIYENGDIKGAGIDIFNNSGHWVLDVNPSQMTTNPAPNQDYLVALPSNVLPASCRYPSCSVQKMFLNNIGASNVVSIRNQAMLTLPLILTGSTFAWDTNGLNFEGQLPEVQVFRGRNFNGQLLGNAPVSVLYQIPSANTYDWTGGPEPDYDVQGDVWNLSASSLASPIPISASDNSTANWDTLRIFVAGALLGIAGGALVGAIQESTHKEEQPAAVLRSSLRDLGNAIFLNSVVP